MKKIIMLVTILTISVFFTSMFSYSIVTAYTTWETKTIDFGTNDKAAKAAAEQLTKDPSKKDVVMKSVDQFGPSKDFSVSYKEKTSMELEKKELDRGGPTTTTTGPPLCGIIGRCESAETQASCPNDCYTTVSISPNVAAIAGQEVALTIVFNDSRYVAGHNAKYSLTIDGIAWNAENGCNIAGVNVTPTADGVGTACIWQGLVKDCTSTSVNGYLKVVTKCNLPNNLPPTSHSLIATPTFYSEETILTGASVKFTIQQKFDFFEWIFSFFR